VRSWTWTWTCGERAGRRRRNACGSGCVTGRLCTVVVVSVCVCEGARDTQPIHSSSPHGAITVAVSSRRPSSSSLAPGRRRCRCWLEDAGVIVVGCRMPVSSSLAGGRRRRRRWLEDASVVVVGWRMPSSSYRCRCRRRRHYRRIVVVIIVASSCCRPRLQANVLRVS
jgi:hypothetical protein